MKTLKNFLSLLLCLTTAAAFSQKTGPSGAKLFASYPDQIAVSKHVLQNTLNASQGEEINISFNTTFNFKGVVISNIKKYDNLQSVMIKSAEFGNAILQVSRIINVDKSISYTGRIINPGAFDGYEQDCSY
jgi:hypothetical protein